MFQFQSGIAGQEANYLCCPVVNKARHVTERDRTRQNVMGDKFS